MQYSEYFSTVSERQVGEHTLSRISFDKFRNIISLEAGIAALVDLRDRTQDPIIHDAVMRELSSRRGRLQFLTKERSPQQVLIDLSQDFIYKPPRRR